MDKPTISREHLSALESAFAGGVLSLLFQRKLTWWTALLIFSSGEIIAFFCAVPGVTAFLTDGAGAGGGPSRLIVTVTSFTGVIGLSPGAVGT